MIVTPLSVRQSRLVKKVRHSVICEPLESRQLLSATIDVRLAAGGKAVTATTVGQVVNMQVWATVSNADGDQSNDGFWEVFGSFLSPTSSGGIKGTLKATVASMFTSGPSSAGTQQDLDGDGDLDVGGKDPSTGTDYFFARAGSVQYTGGTLTSTSNSFKIATLTFTVTSLGNGAATNINFSARPTSNAALWVEDGNPKNPATGTLVSGPAVVVSGSAVVTGSIAGNVFNDANGNGTKDSGEAGLTGRTLYNDANNNSKLDSGEATTTTDVNGNYTFSGLTAGTYKIRQILPAGSTQTTPTGNFGQTVTLTTGQNATGKNFGDKGTVVVTGSIAGNVFNDANGNGTKDTGEAGLAGRTLYNDANNNSKLDSGEATATTDSSGNYTFSGLAAGSYKIRQVLPAGSTQTTPANNFGQTVTLSSGQNATGKNFGDKAAAAGSIAGTVFNDLNANGTQNSGEAGLSGWKVYLDTNNNSLLDSGEVFVTTTSTGAYTFTGLAAGTYKVRVVRPTGWTQTSPTNNFGQTVTITAGQAATGKSFGEKQ